MESSPLINGSVPTRSFNSVNASEAQQQQDNQDPDAVFTCNICLDSVKDKDPVVTQCGHLYCWPCLYRWLQTQRNTCPVCKAGVSHDNVIPIFIRGSMNDPRHRQRSGTEGGGETPAAGAGIPNRPIGHRPEPLPVGPAGGGAGNNQFNINSQFGGISFSAGFGFFPSLFGLQFQTFVPPHEATNNAVGNNSPPPHQSHENEMQEKYLSRVLWMLGLAVILSLLVF